MSEASEGDESLQTIRQRIIKRDGHTCQDCGVFVGSRLSELPTGHMHHIDENPENNTPDNLVTLCHGCHNDRHDHYVPDGTRDTELTAHYGDDNPRWNGGRYTAPNGYIYVMRPDHPNAGPRGYVGEHRLVAVNMIDRPLKSGEVVHHKNEDRSDNRPENLEVLTIAEHMVRHRGEDSNLRLPGEENISIMCACGCGETLEKYDESGRPREYLHGHNSKGQHSPTQDRTLEVLSQFERPVKTQELIESIDTTSKGVKSAQQRLNEKGKIESPCRGYWCLAGSSTGGEADD